MAKKTVKKIQKTQKVAEVIEQPVKRKRGRPRKVYTPEELAEIERNKKPKLTLAEKQAIKLKAQKEKEAAKIARGEAEPKNKERFYCTNKELQAELITWRDSAKKVEDRIMSEELGKMMLAIGNKLLNHSSFRNYPKEVKEDCLGFGLYKLIKGLKNYNFEFNNPFAWFTQAFFNAYLSVISKYYNDINIRKELVKKLSSELESFSGIASNTSLNKYIKSYYESDAGNE